MIGFDPKDIFIREDSPSLEYKKLTSYGGKIVDKGQLKLLIAKILFLINHWDTEKYKDIVLLVWDTASSEHYGPILELFPKIKRIEIWNQNPVELSDSEYERNGRVKIYNELLTINKAERIYKKSEENIFFISDFYTAGEQQSFDQYESTVWSDLLLQKQMVEKIKPIESMLRFRLVHQRVVLLFDFHKIDPVGGFHHLYLHVNADIREVRLA